MKGNNIIKEKLYRLLQMSEFINHKGHKVLHKEHKKL